MNETTKRTTFAPDFKTKAGLEAIRRLKTIDEIDREFGRVGNTPLQCAELQRELN